MTLQSYADTTLTAAIAASGPSRAALYAALSQIPAPIYVTDAAGYVVFFNPWCTGLAGRIPQAGKDRWCVTWKLFTNAGEFLPHDACPMAQALRERTPIRGLTAVAERPDGSRVTFMPFPTPLFDADGELAGAVNMLVDVTERRQPHDLLSQADRCERLAPMVGDKEASTALALMAIQYRIKAAALEMMAAPAGADAARMTDHR